ncbi:hypothetical protein [Actinomadura kijaniata]|uniref:hypothetical protein n=1 Tax=Actinomadura kijaniata TaxID=46161 RepID=UPI000A832E00|nr:hypothetical protein [Actinomadura kijaniata]
MMRLVSEMALVGQDKTMPHLTRLSTPDMPDPVREEARERVQYLLQWPTEETDAG